MKQFLKLTLASTLGLFLGTLLLFIIALIVGSSLSSSGSKVTIEDNSLLKIDLNGTYVEQAVDNPFNLVIPGLPMDATPVQQGLDRLRLALRKAAANPKIKGIYLVSGTMVTGWVTAEEIRNALLAFKKSGKFIVAYGELLDQKEYYVCSVADTLYLNPEGMINLHGLSVNHPFYKETLDKIGVKPEIFRVGTFKSAVEPYLLTGMSDASRLQTKVYLNDLWGHLLDGMAAGRKLPKNTLETIASKNTLFEAAGDLVREHLADKLMYETDMEALLARKMGEKEWDDVHLVSIDDLYHSTEGAETAQRDKIAVLYAEGDIYESGTEGIVAKDLIRDIQKIRKDSLIKAVVFRVNSRGGSAYASEQIWKAVQDLKRVKPVVVSMGDYAASGGYYISCGANSIVASPNTLTGSIGIFGMFFTFQELSQKVGLHYDVVKTYELSDLGDLNRPMTDLEKRKIQLHVERGYSLFVKRCSEGRRMSEASLRTIAEGRVWTGARAKQIGLVDAIGGIDKAFEIAARLGKVTQYRTVSYPEKKDYVTRLMEEVTGKTKMRLVREWLGEDFAPLLELKKSKFQTGILAKSDLTDIH